MAKQAISKPSLTEPAFHGPETELPQDWDRLADYLARQGFEMSRAHKPRRFSGGFGNLNYRLEVDGRLVVLRRPPPGPLPPGANDMKREHRILSVLWQEFPAAPRSFHYCEDEQVLGAPFFIMEYRPGLLIDREIPEGLKARPGLGSILTSMMVETLAALHAVDANALGLGGFGRPEGFLQRTVEGWSQRASLAADGETPAPAKAVSDWLRKNLVSEQGPSLLHNDFKLDNILLDPDSLEPAAVLDWDQGTRGDPLFDFATFLSYWIEPGDPPAMHQMGQMPTASGPGFPARDRVVELYAKRTGLDVSNFLFYRVLGMFKLCVIFMQLHARYRRGATREARYAGFGEVADGLLDFTHEIAQGRAF